MKMNDYHPNLDGPAEPVGLSMPTEDEMTRLRKRCSELHRRLQQAEAGVASFKRKWDQHGGPRGGSFGRALLASECARLEKFLVRLGNALRSQNEQWGLYGKESKDALKEFESEMKERESIRCKPA